VFDYILSIFIIPYNTMEMSYLKVVTVLSVYCYLLQS